MNDDDVARALLPDASPAKTPATFAEIVGRILLGIVSFAISVLVFATVMAVNQPIGLIASVAAFVGLFAVRKRSGPSPKLGAVVVGAAVALAVSGTCTLIVMSLN